MKHYLDCCMLNTMNRDIYVFTYKYWDIKEGFGGVEIWINLLLIAL